MKRININESQYKALLSEIIDGNSPDQLVYDGDTYIRLTESDLHRIVKESVQKILKEEYDPIGQFADICCKDEEILRCKTAEEVFNTINGHLQKTYKGRATERKIASVAKDVTVSVCLKLHIPGI